MFNLNFVSLIQKYYFNLPKLSFSLYKGDYIQIKFTMVGFIHKAKHQECSLLSFTLARDSTRDMALFYHCLDGVNGMSFRIQETTSFHILGFCDQSPEYRASSEQ